MYERAKFSAVARRRQWLPGRGNAGRASASALRLRWGAFLGLVSGGFVFSAQIAGRHRTRQAATGLDRQPPGPPPQQQRKRKARHAVVPTRARDGLGGRERAWAAWRWAGEGD